MSLFSAWLLLHKIRSCGSHHRHMYFTRNMLNIDKQFVNLFKTVSTDCIQNMLRTVYLLHAPTSCFFILKVHALLCKHM